MPKKTEAGFPWEGFFAPHILLRGWDYYQEGAVTDLRETGKGTYRAIVLGTEDYCVEIETEDGDPVSMECDCPYADSGNNCKHMAAVLYAIENRRPHEDNMETDDIPEDESAEKIVSRIPDSDLRPVLIDLCQKDEDVRRQLFLRYAGAVNSAYLKKLHGDLEQICRQYSDRSGFINWRNASDFEDAVTSFLTDNTVPLVKRGEPMLAFQLVNDTLMRVGEQDLDDDGQLTYIATIGYDCWSLILAACSSAEKEKMFQWFSDHMDEGDLPFYFEDTAEEFYEKEFRDPVFLQKKLERYQVSGPIPSQNNFHEYFVYEHRVVEMLKLMTNLSYPEETIQKQIERFYPLSGARQFAIDHALQQGKTDKAISILLESKTLDREYPGLVSEYSEKLIDLFEKEGREEDCKQELLFQIFKCRQDNLNHITKLKSKCDPAEWEQTREKILTSFTCAGIHLPLLAAEGLDDRLLESIIRSGFVYALDDYEKRLKKKYPEKVRNAYVDYVRKSMPAASNRKQYAGIILYLKKLRYYPEGNLISKQIALEWRKNFPMRRAMLDELAKAGF